MLDGQVVVPPTPLTKLSSTDGVLVGAADGASVSPSLVGAVVVGDADGTDDGCEVGVLLGSADGFRVGKVVGPLLG